MPRKKEIRRRKSTGLSPTEELYVSGAKYKTPLPPGCNKWEWLELHSGGGNKLTRERWEYLEGLRKANNKRPAACVPV